MHFKSVLFILVLLVLGVQRRAFSSEQLPFEYRDGLIWVKVESGGFLFHFVLDSGAESSVISLETVKRLGVKLGSAQTVHAVSALVRACRVDGFNATVAGVHLKGNPLAMDLSGVSRSCSRSIDGLIGHEFFQGRIVQINYKKQLIRLLDAPETSSACVADLPLQVRQGALFIPIRVEDSKPRWIRLDTGCDEGLHWVLESQKYQSQKYAFLAFSHSKSDSCFSTVQLGNQKLERVRTVFHRKPLFPGEAGLLGNGILSNYRVTIDSVSNRVIFD